MCPVAAESKNSKPSPKKIINKKINTNLDAIIIEQDTKEKENDLFLTHIELLVLLI